MLTTSILLGVLNGFPVCWKDRADPRKPEQLATVAAAITTVANASKNPIDKAGKLLTIFYHESRGCLDVHSGAHRGRGRGPFQLEGQSKRHEGPFVGLDYESTLNAAQVAGDILDHSFQCGSSPRDVFTAYGARPCGSTWKTLNERVATYRWATWRLSKWSKN